MSEGQLSKRGFNLIELVNSAGGYHIAGKPNVVVEPELLYVFVMKGFDMASTKKLMLEELLSLNGGYISQEDLHISLLPEKTNAYFFGIGINIKGLRRMCELGDYFFFPVVYCRIDESHLK